MINREFLEKKALELVSASEFYNLNDCINETSDKDLINIINQKRLKYLILQHELSYNQTAKILSVSAHTVKSWLVSRAAKNSRNCPANMLELLELKLNKIN